MEQKMEQLQVCPICTKEDPCLALSRHDDETEICSDCGTLEGLIVAGLVMSEETIEFANGIAGILEDTPGWAAGPLLARVVERKWLSKTLNALAHGVDEHHVSTKALWEIHRVKMLIAKGCYTDFVFPKTD